METQRALTIRQPYAQLIALGLKRTETRWRPAALGPMVVHAGTRRTPDEGDAWDALHARWNGYPLPYGALIAVVDVVEVRRATEAMFRADRSLGDYAPGRWAWTLDNIRVLDRPIPARGNQWFWHLDRKMQRAVDAQLSTAVRR